MLVHLIANPNLPVEVHLFVLTTLSTKLVNTMSIAFFKQKPPSLQLTKSDYNDKYFSFSTNISLRGPVPCTIKLFTAVFLPCQNKLDCSQLSVAFTLA
jgi:hypothetical protein